MTLLSGTRPADGALLASATALIEALDHPAAVADAGDRCVAANAGFASAHAQLPPSALVGRVLERRRDAVWRPLKGVRADGWHVVTLPQAGFSHRALRALFDAVPALVNVKDRQSRYLFMNAYQARLYAIDPDDAVGRTAGEMLGADYGRYTGGMDRRVVETRQAWSYEESYADADGTVHDWLTTKAPVLGPDGRVAAVATVALEITDRKRLERQLEGALVAAEAASEAKSRFLANVSHELRTPLNAVLGFSEVIADEMFGPAGTRAYVDYARDIRSAGLHLLRLVEEVLDLTRAETGRIDLAVEPVDLARMVDRALDMLRLPVASKALTLAVDLPHDLPRLSADPTRLTQIVLNLASNAVKFTDPGGRVRVAAKLREDGWLALSVADTGIGFRPEDIDVVLAPFGRVETPGVPRREGAGLGIPVARALIEAHGGTLEFDSRPGDGTLVTAAFPPERVLPA